MSIFNPKFKLLVYFYILVLAINSIAILLDFILEKFSNAIIEVIFLLLLSCSAYFLYVSKKIKISAYIFLLMLSSELFLLIYMSNFATLSVVFVLLLPLSTLLFLRLKETIIAMIFHVGVFVGLVYFEYLNNPQNPLIQSPQALFNLAYAIIIIYFFGILYHLFIIKTFDELDEANVQKSILLGEIHHRVKNNLNVIASMIGLQALSLSKKEKDPLLQTKTRIEAMGMVHEMLYNDNNIHNVDVKSYIVKLSILLFDMYNQKNIHLHISTNNIKLSLKTMFQLAIIVNELFTNTLKYAFSNQQGTIHVSLKKEKNKYLFKYKDDGKGVTSIEELKKCKSLGFKLINLSSKQLKGKLDIISTNPLTYVLEFSDE